MRREGERNTVASSCHRTGASCELRSAGGEDDKIRTMERKDSRSGMCPDRHFAERERKGSKGRTCTSEREEKRVTTQRRGRAQCFTRLRALRLTGTCIGLSGVGPDVGPVELASSRFSPSPTSDCLPWKANERRDQCKQKRMPIRFLPPLPFAVAWLRSEPQAWLHGGNPQ
jgi:hypothetical protein